MMIDFKMNFELDGEIEDSKADIFISETDADGYTPIDGVFVMAEKSVQKTLFQKVLGL